MVCRTRLSAFTGLTGPTPLQATASATTLFPFNSAASTIPFLAYNIVDSAGQIIVPGVASSPNAQVTYANYVRYCEFPGNRLFNLVKFDVNGNPLDQYDEMVPTMLEKFCTPPNKRTGFNRLVGQETPLEGYSGLRNAIVTDANGPAGALPPPDYGAQPAYTGGATYGPTIGTPVTASGITRNAANQSNATVALFNANISPLVNSSATAVVASGLTLIANGGTTTNTNNLVSPLNSVYPTPQYDVSRQLLQIVNGPQTPKPQQPPLEIWNKLRFWFNDDVRLSIASVSIPYGQRFITMEITQQSNLTFEYPSIFLEQIVDYGTGFKRYKSYQPIFQPFGVGTVNIEKMELYINNIFVNPEINMGLKKYMQKHVLVNSAPNLIGVG